MFNLAENRKAQFHVKLNDLCLIASKEKTLPTRGLNRSREQSLLFAYNVVFT